MRHTAAGFGIISAWLLFNTVGFSDWHTDPSKWEKPRNFHSPFKTEYNDRFELGRAAISDVTESKKFSPNNAYWFITRGIDTGSGDAQGSVYIYNERGYLIELKLNYYANFGADIKWINEKLLFVRFFLGRIERVSI